LVIIHCNDLTVIMLKMYKAAAVLSAGMKVYIIPCYARGHINVMLVLQSCADSVHILPGSSGESHATSSDGTCNFSNMEVEGDVDVIEEGFIPINEEAVLGIKQEEIPEDINFPDIKSEPDEVSYVCVCVCVCVSVIRHILLVSGNVSWFCDVNIGLLKISTVGNKRFCCDFFLGGGAELCWWEVLYSIGWSACNCREEENMFLYPCS